MSQQSLNSVRRMAARQRVGTLGHRHTAEMSARNRGGGTKEPKVNYGHLLGRWVNCVIARERRDNQAVALKPGLLLQQVSHIKRKEHPVETQGP